MKPRLKKHLSKQEKTMRKTNKLSQAENIRQYFKKHPEKTVREVADAMGVKYQIAYMVKRGMEDREKKLAKQIITVSAVDTPTQIEMFEPAVDPVNHPAHYKTGGIETIDFIEAKKLNYNLGNVVKYVTRADHKGNRKQDLEKALWYLNRELNKA